MHVCIYIIYIYIYIYIHIQCIYIYIHTHNKYTQYTKQYFLHLNEGKTEAVVFKCLQYLLHVLWSLQYILVHILYRSFVHIIHSAY